jgi:hypothetical protein
MEKLADLLEVLEPEHDPEEAANWTMGMVSVRLGRYRQQLLEHLSTPLNPLRSLRSLLLFAALYLDVSEAVLLERGAALRLSNAEIDRLTAITRHFRQVEHLAETAAPPSRRAVYRFFRDTGVAGVDICLLSLAAILAVHGPALPQTAWVRRLDMVRTLLEAWWEQHTERVDPPALLNGHTLMHTLQLTGGPEVGRVLEAIREAQAAGEVSTREEALQLARNLISPNRN